MDDWIPKSSDATKALVPLILNLLVQLYCIRSRSVPYETENLAKMCYKHGAQEGNYL